MTDLIARLHAQAKKRAIATETIRGERGDYEVTHYPRHQLEIAHKVREKLAADIKSSPSGQWYGRLRGHSMWEGPGTFVEVVVALAEKEP